MKASVNNVMTSSAAGVFAYITSLLVALVTAKEQLIAAPLPIFYIPDACENIQLNGLPRATIVSQRGDRYSSNTACTLTLSVRGPYVLRFTFDHLDLATPTRGGVCEDYVQLFNSNSAPLSERICGTERPSLSFTSNSSSVSLVFSTDQFRERTGFRINYQRVGLTPSSATKDNRSCQPGSCKSNTSSSLRGTIHRRTAAVLLIAVFTSIVLLH